MSNVTLGLNHAFHDSSACIVRDGEVIVPSGASRLEAHDHLFLVALPENQEALLLALTGD